MAHFLILLDSDARRRQAFMRAAEAEICPVEGLAVGRAGTGELSILWAAGPRAPISLHREEHSTAIIWGDALPAGASRRISAAELAQLWNGVVLPESFDGFHAAAAYEAEAGITVGADLLGLFPVYYAAAGDTLLVGSSPELFRLHPLFPAAPDTTGLMGLLVAGALFRGRTLLRSVRRLAPGHVLRWKAGRGAEEIRQYTIPASTGLHGIAFAEQVEALDAAWAGAVERHSLGGSHHGILLSGGRDSRLIAGYLSQGQSSVMGLTFGRETDYEAICASAVAGKSGFDHRLVPLDEAGMPRAAELQARWEHLATGFGSVHMWQAIEPLRDLPDRFFAGYVREIRERGADLVEFEAFFAAENRLAIPVLTLQRLIRPEAVTVSLDELFLRARGDYEAGAESPEDRPWRWILAHRARAHPGGVPWRLSFASWPVLPILDREALATLAALPGYALAGRRVQDAILRTRFPRLARLPLDRNSDDLTPLVPSLRDRLKRSVSAGRDVLGRLLPRRLSPSEHRYYYRMYDFNGPGWRAVRRRAEPNRERLEAWFCMEALRAYLPPPEVELRCEDAIMDSFGRKLLVGLMLWSEPLA